MKINYPSLESFNFLGIETDIKNAEVFILPIPYEASTTYGSNTKSGPLAIIEASRHLELYDDELKTDTSKIGIFTGPFLEPDTRGPKQMTERIYQTVKQILKSKKIPAILGGEHTISVGAVKACREFFKDLSVLHFDAHADLRDSYEGSPYNHACALRRIREFTKKTVSIGIRSFSEEEAGYLKKNPECRVYNASLKNLNRKEILAHLSKNVYLTFDLDAFDPSIIPSTGTPEPGGLYWAEVLEILKEVFKNKNVVAFDVVELAPIPGLIHPDFLSAKLIYKIIGYIFKFCRARF